MKRVLNIIKMGLVEGGFALLETITMGVNIGFIAFAAFYTFVSLYGLVR